MNQHYRPDRKPSGNNKKPQAWSHQHELASLIGKNIRICLGGPIIHGKLVAADQFTLKVVDLYDEATVYFKSAIVSFKEA